MHSKLNNVGNLRTIEDPVADAYLQYLKDGKTNYLEVLVTESVKNKESIKASISRQVLAMQPKSNG